MNKRCTLSGSFEHFGAEPKNPRWSWSALTPDHSTVVLTLWKDMISFVDKVPHYHDPTPNFEKWKDTPGNRDRLNHIKHAVDHCSGRFRAIVTVAKNVEAIPREIAECYPCPDIWMRVTSFDESTGAWSAVFDRIGN